MAENVRVAVRVRPFVSAPYGGMPQSVRTHFGTTQSLNIKLLNNAHNSREQARGAKCIIDMNGATTIIKDPEQPGSEPKKFAFDFSYWSHDGFKEEENGYLSPSTPKYADQKVVFDDLGQGVLSNAWNGYNCSLFAYGQTGSGKSYSMMGYGANKGIIPIACDELFKGIDQKKAKAGKGEEYQVSFSMLEIYNEQVRDLLNPKSNVKGGLTIRQHPSKGFYVDQLVTAPVSSFEQIDGKINEGTMNRTVAATNMNATSSRAHTIVAINFTQKSPNASGESMTKTASINLVDLAGSERAESTGATGDRLKEGSAINKSLSSLGNVIKALADISMGKKKVQVPFRDSSLTKLLKNALGGNSKTIMIAALSPADINYEETLGTLRFADRAKSIKTKAVINESPTDKLIRELREENQKLMDMLKGGGVMPIEPGQAAQTSEEVDEMKKAMEEAMKKNQEEMEEMKKTWEQRLAEQSTESDAKIAAEKDKQERKKVVPHFWNLNEDPSLTAMVVHFCNPGASKVGSRKADPAPDILLNGLSIQAQHASINNDKNKVMITPGANAKILVNGAPIKTETLLHHNDRVMFGSNHLYVFHHPQDMAKHMKDGTKLTTPTYESAQEEIAESSGLIPHGDGPAGSGKSKEDLILQEDLIQILPMISEANAMSEELDKKVKFDVNLISPQARGLKEGRTEVCVSMKNLTNDNEWVWDRNKFINRKYMMQEMYQNFIEGDKDWDVEQDKDPFYESPDTEVLIGSCQVFLQSLQYNIEVEEEALKVTNTRGNEQGVMAVMIQPCDAKGKDLGDDDFVEDPKQLVGKPLHFKLRIKKVQGLPPRFVKSLCRHKFYLDEKSSETQEMANTINPNFNYEKKYSFNAVTPQLLEYLNSSPLVVEVYGKQKGTASGATKQDTKSLMQKEKSTVQPAKKEEPAANNKALAELQTFKKRAERSEGKLAKIQNVVNECQKKKQDKVDVAIIDKILSNLADTATAVKQEKAKEETLGKTTSQACNVQ